MGKDTVVIIVKDSSVTKEEIEGRIRLYCSSHGIEVFTDYKVVTQAEYDKRLERTAIATCPYNDGRVLDALITPEIIMRPSKTELCQKRTDKQRREQEKLARKHYKKQKQQSPL